MADPRRKRGKQLAQELERFVRRETDSAEDAAAVLVGACEYLSERTTLARDPSAEPWPVETQAKLAEPN